MINAKRTYDWSSATPIALLLGLQIVGLIVPFVLILPISRKDWLLQALGSAQQIQVGILWLLLNALTTFWISIRLRPILPQPNAFATRVLIVMSVLMLVFQIVDAFYLHKMLEMSRDNGSLMSGSQAALSLVASRRIAHYAVLCSIDAWLFLMYGLLGFANLVPRSVAAFGLITVSLHFFGLLLPMMLGGKGVVTLGATMALGHLVLICWLLTRGFVRSLSSL